MSLLALALTGCSFDSSLDEDQGAWSNDTGSSYGDEDGDGWESDTDTDADSDTDTDTDADIDTDSDFDTGESDTDTGDTDTAAEACDDTTPVTLYLSPDDSNSMSSPVQLRDAVLAGWDRLDQVPIRTWEFLNYYSFDYDAPDEGLRVVPQLAMDAAGHYVLQIGVVSPTLAPEDREPLNVVLVLDTSGSMDGTPIELLKETSLAIASNLRQGDVVSVVEWSERNAVHLEEHAVTGPDDPTLVATIDALAAGGGTNLYGGLVAGYDIAARTYDPAAINRVVLVSDGGANLGVTSEELISQHAGEGDEEGVYLVGVGVGAADEYDDTLMDAVTDLGRGASLFVGSSDEIARQFSAEGFLRVMDVAAREVSVRLDLPPGFRIVRFSGEEYSSDPRQIEPQHLAPNDAMVFYQTLETCAPELVTDDTTLTVTATWLDPLTYLEGSDSVTYALSELATDTRLLEKGVAVYTYAESLKECQRVSASECPTSLVPARTALERAELSNPGDADLAELRAVIEALGG